MYNPLAVANFFIEKAIDTGVEVTPMKLVKLVYIAHGWYLAIKGEPLISQGAQAWKFGPVVPEVYHKFKHRGSKPVSELAEIYTNINVVIPRVQDDYDKSFLDSIWQAYSKYNGIELSNLTHQKDTPWHKVWREKGGSTKRGAVIPNELIQKHYRVMLNANKERAGAR